LLRLPPLPPLPPPREQADFYENQMKNEFRFSKKSIQKRLTETLKKEMEKVLRGGAARERFNFSEKI
jgi:hypothetical protein